MRWPISTKGVLNITLPKVEEAKKKEIKVKVKKSK